MPRRKFEPRYCINCEGPLTSSPFTPEQPADSDLCAPCWWASVHPMGLISLDELDELISKVPLGADYLLRKALQGALVDWHGDIGQFVVMPNGVLRIRVTMTCSLCGGHPQVYYAGSGLHSGAWPYIYTEDGQMLGNIRDAEYQCESCQKDKATHAQRR